MIRQEQHSLGHATEDLRITVVQVPLKRVERGPDPTGDLRPKSEAAGVFVWEDLAQVPLVSVRHLPVRKHPVVALVVGIACQRTAGPGVLIGGVIDNEVEHETDPVLAQIGGQIGQLSHTAQARVDLAVAADGVAAIVLPRRCAEHRHQVEVGEPQLGQVLKPGSQTGQVAREAVNVADAAQHPLRLKPVWVSLTPRIERLELW